MPLLAALMVGATTAAPPSPEEAALREIQALINDGNGKLAEPKAAAAVQRFSASDTDAAWLLRAAYAETLIIGAKQQKAWLLLQKMPPQRFAKSEVFVKWRMVRAIALVRLERPAEADAELRIALELAKAYQPRLVPSALIGLAQFGQRHELSVTEPYLREAIRIASAAHDEVTVGKAQAAIARQYTFAERYNEAIRLNEAAFARMRALRQTFTASQIAGNLGWAYEEIGDYDSAADYFSQAFELAQRGGLTTDAIRWMSQLGSIRSTQRDYARAEKLYRDALVLARTNHLQREIAESLSNLAEIALETARIADARVYSAEALKIKRARQDASGELTSLITEARIATAEGRFDEASKTLKRVAATAKETATRWTAHYRLAETYTRAKRNELADAAFRQAIATADAARKDVKNDLRLSFFNLVDEVHDRYVDFLVDRKRIEDALRIVDERRALTLAEGLKLEASAKKKFDPRATAKLAGATLLCYSLGRTRSYVWTVTPAAITIAALPPDREINAKVEAYQRDLLNSRVTFQASLMRGEELYRMLVAPAGAIARGSRAVMIPDGSLHMLNFETLVAPAPTPHYWIEDAIVITAPSIQLLARNVRSTPPAKSMLLVGDVPPVEQFPALKNAPDEVNRVAARFNSETVLRGATATPSAYVKASPNAYEYIHFVAHGVATRQKPLDSAIILAREGDRYKLYAREIIEHQLRARLVTISSCYGAGTRAYAGEGLVGLAWAFLRAGAGQVIAALWEVDDNTTPPMMDRMYEEIRAGKDPAIALRDAKLKLVRSTGVTRRPRYWAPFVLYSGS